MKKSFIVLMSVAIFTSCGGNSKKDDVVTEEVQITTEEVATPDAGLPDESNALSSLDYEGTYVGTLPSASGEGMKVTITLGDKDYTKEIQYVGKKTEPIKEKGTYKWDTAGNTITLESAEKPNQYFVGENIITQLDVDGNKITGDMANLYVLKKQ